MATPATTTPTDFKILAVEITGSLEGISIRSLTCRTEPNTNSQQLESERIWEIQSYTSHIVQLDLNETWQCNSFEELLMDG